MRGPLLNISDDMTYLYVAGDAANIGVVVVANVFVAPDVVAIVFFLCWWFKTCELEIFYIYDC